MNRRKNPAPSQVRNRNRKRNQRGRAGYLQEVRRSSGGEMTLSRNPASDSTLVVLTYVEPNTAFGNNLGNAWSKEYVMNSAYDPDPLIGGGTISFYPQWASIYYRYRVIRFDYTVEFVNDLTGSVALAAVCPTKESLGSNSAYVRDFAETSYGKTHMVPAAGSNNRVTFRGSVDLASFSGHHGYLYDDVTSSLNNTSPSQRYYFNVGAYSIAAQSSGSFGVLIKLRYHTLFFDRQSPFV